MGRDIARVLGATRQRGGALEGNGWLVTWCIGHLIELEDPAVYDGRWKRWDLDTLPMVPAKFQLRVSKDSTKQWRVVRELLRRNDVERVVNACDAGREGELIFRFVYDKAACHLPVDRLWISSLTDEAIKDGFAKLAPGSRYDDLGDAARCRAEADWLVGLNATRAMTLVERGRGPDEGVWSVGRVQTPTLALIVERERAIQTFVPRDFWTLEAKVPTEDGGTFSALWQDRAGSSRVASAAMADTLKARVEEAKRAQGDGLIVERVDDKVLTDRAPQFFDLTSLQRVANRRFGFSAERTSKIAQSLYERHKMITYPRTDARVLSEDQRDKIPAVLRSLQGRPGIGVHAEQVLSAGPRITRRVINDQQVTDHHAIIPTGRSSRLDGDEAKLFDLIATRFVAALCADAKIAVTKVLLRAGEGPMERKSKPDPEAAERLLERLEPPPDGFVARGRVVIEPGWQLVEPPAKSSEQALPRLSEGDRVQAELQVNQGRTRPPRRHTDATLLSSMEYAGREVDDETLRRALRDRGLGTPATRASMIETLIRRDYVVRSGRNLAPTDKGIKLIERLSAPTLSSAELTGHWEARLAEMARGEGRRDLFMADAALFASQVVEAISATAGVPAKASELVGERGSGGARKGRGYERSGRGRGRQRGSSGRSASRGGSSGGGSSGGGSSRGGSSRGGSSRSGSSRGRSSREGSSREGSSRSASTRRDSESSRNASARGRDSASSRHASASRRDSASSRHANTGSRRDSAPRATNPTARTTVTAEHLGELICPRCSNTGLVAGRRAWGCARWRDGCQMIVPYESHGRKLTKAQLEDLLRRGKTRPFTSDGKKARLVLDGDVRLEWE